MDLHSWKRSAQLLEPRDESGVRAVDHNVNVDELVIRRPDERSNTFVDEICIRSDDDRSMQCGQALILCWISRATRSTVRFSSSSDSGSSEGFQI